jgi:hypothetical protein
MLVNFTKRMADDARNAIAKQIKAENDAILSFFAAPAPKKKKKRAAPEKNDNSDGHNRLKEKKKLRLAVPANEPTPFVKQMEAAGAGYAVNLRTDQVKKVRQGKHASKGRGVVSANVVPTKQIDFVPIADSEWDAPYDDDDKVETAVEQGEDDEPTMAKSTKLGVSTVTSDKVVVDEDVASPLVRKKDEVGRPIYNNELWAESSVRCMITERKEVPAFYVRRAENTKSFELDNGREQCRILTFHPDGSFVWPASSKFLCWNCCHGFDGPPAMIPRDFSRRTQAFHVYGNFCNWACAKRYSMNTSQEYFSDTAPSLDYFAWKYFGVSLPVPIAPQPFLLESFSEYGMTIEEYRGDNPPVHQVLHPPCLPYEIMVTWSKRHPGQHRLKTGYEPEKKRLFEERMAGLKPMPEMPAGVDESNKTISDIMPGKLVPAGKTKKRKTLLNLLK